MNRLETSRRPWAEFSPMANPRLFGAVEGPQRDCHVGSLGTAMAVTDLGFLAEIARLSIVARGQAHLRLTVAMTGRL